MTTMARPTYAVNLRDDLVEQTPEFYIRHADSIRVFTPEVRDHVKVMIQLRQFGKVVGQLGGSVSQSLVDRLRETYDSTRGGLQQLGDVANAVLHGRNQAQIR